MVVLGKQGRLVVPAEIRERLGLTAGDQLRLQVVGRRVVLERPDDAVLELRELGAGIPRPRSLVDELLEERRAAAGSE